VAAIGVPWNCVVITEMGRLPRGQQPEEGYLRVACKRTSGQAKAYHNSVIKHLIAAAGTALHPAGDGVPPASAITQARGAVATADSKQR
jgi:hypothetical protein